MEYSIQDGPKNGVTAPSQTMRFISSSAKIASFFGPDFGSRKNKKYQKKILIKSRLDHLQLQSNTHPMAWGTHLFDARLENASPANDAKTLPIFHKTGPVSSGNNNSQIGAGHFVKAPGGVQILAHKAPERHRLSQTLSQRI